MIIATDKFEITGNLNSIGKREVISNFLRCQIGAGVDDSKPKKRDKYTINLKWDPSEDKFYYSDDTGNKGLRDGILMSVLERL